MSVAPPVRQINMAAPGALNTDVIMTDQQTTLPYYNNTKIGNKILNIQNALDPAAGLSYFIKTQRNGRETRRWYSTQLLTTFTGAVRPGFPVDIASGIFQWVGQQTLGALTAQSWLVTYLADF